MTKRIVLTCKDGEIHAEAEGYKGDGCVTEIKELLDKADLTMEPGELKDEYYEREDKDRV